MDEPVDIVLGDGLGDALGALDMHIGEGEVPGRSARPYLYPPPCNSLGRIVPANQVVHDIRMPDALLDRLGVAQVVFLEPFSICLSRPFRLASSQ